VARGAGDGPRGPAAGAIHGMHQGHVRSHVTRYIGKSRYLHSTDSLVRIGPIDRDGPLDPTGAKPPRKESSMLVLARKLGERIMIGDRIVVTVVKLDHGQVRLGIEAPREIPVFRKEIDPRLHPLVQPAV
jgi:carbon storage regulator